MPFKKGQRKPQKSGRKKGARNRTTLEIRSMARELLDEDYFHELKLRLRAGTTAAGVETLIHYYAFGKPKQTVAFEEDPRVSVEAFRRLAGLGSDDENGSGEPEPKPEKKPPKAPTAPAKVRVGTVPKKSKLALQGR